MTPAISRESGSPFTGRSSRPSQARLGCSGLLAVAVGLLAFLAGCAVTPPKPEEALTKSTAPTFVDDAPLAPLLNALPAHVDALEKMSGGTVRFGPTVVTVNELIDGFELLLSILQKSSDPRVVSREIREHFDFYRAEGPAFDGSVLLTGYYEPEIEGSSYPTEKFTQPLYKAPSDLVRVELGKFVEGEGVPAEARGRLAGNTVTPYYSRAEIDQGNVLKGHGLELAWVDPIDAFFLQIQGSGTVRFPSGAEMILGYGDKNGRPYFPIGRALKDKIPETEMSMTTIQRHLRGVAPEEQQRILNLNESYVFFTRSHQHATTSMGVEATAGRTLAVDPRFFPRGALGLVLFNEPVFDSVSSAIPKGSVSRARLILNQDAGGAIAGPGRADLFFGRGPQAGQSAGALKDADAALYYLLPKGSPAQP